MQETTIVGGNVKNDLYSYLYPNGNYIAAHSDMLLQTPLLPSFSTAAPHLSGGALSSPQYSNTLQQQPAATASCCRISRSLSQILCTLCCDISCSRRGSAAYLYVLGLNSRWQPAFFLYSDFVSPFSVFSVLTHIELSVSCLLYTSDAADE